ncbi:hypothetical protein NS334_08590 [Sphingomonas endophytica]|uniref:Uncharacterized protein n=1 Tax=Sphingomonas endophytica TaxID=869719 RepID=A0A147I3G5_9SPHN|nr:hypothetical protein NS334_08590 [Sphingomonas endophytica]
MEVGQSPIRDQMWADAASMIANGEAVAVDLEVNPPKVARRALTAIRADNGRRVPCPHCQLMCLPETLARHVSFCRDDGEAVRRSTSRVPSNQPPAGSGSRPDATPVPVPSKPAGATAGALSRLPETHRE